MQWLNQKTVGRERTACLSGKANVLLGRCTPVSATKCSKEGARQTYGGVSCGMSLVMSHFECLGWDPCVWSAEILHLYCCLWRWKGSALNLRELYCTVGSGQKLHRLLQNSPYSLVLPKVVRIFIAGPFQMNYSCFILFYFKIITITSAWWLSIQ